MSTIQKHKCDQCGREVVKAYEEIGWIRLCITSLSISLGPERTTYLKDIATVGVGEFDFCDHNCLAGWIVAQTVKHLRPR
jgi:hypothetical protein